MRNLGQYLWGALSSLGDWQCLFFQIISTLAVIQSKYPSFRHNDLKANNILISKTDVYNKKLLYKVNKKEYILPSIGYCIYLWDFDLLFYRQIDFRILEKVFLFE